MNAETPVTFVTANGTHVVVPWHDGLKEIVPHAKDFAWRGARMLIMPNDHTEARLARNLGIAVPAPILTRYDWRGSQPWDIQRTTAALLTESPRAYVLSSMGTGKSRAVLYAADYLMRTGQASRMLIVAPLSTLTPVWERECFTLFMSTRKVVVLYGTKEKRLKLLDEGAAICVINHDGLKVLGPAIAEAGFDIVVLDELATYRNRQTDRWKFATTVVNHSNTQFAWGLTGSPTPNAPTDAWAQVKMLTPARVPRTFNQFQDHTMRRVSTFKWLPRPEANTIVRQAMSPSVRYTREDVMELPECSWVDRQVGMDKQAADAYRLLYAKARMLTQQGESITAVNEGVLQSKLLQVSCGFIYTDKKTIFALPSTGRLNALDEVISETDRKLLVLVPFLHALDGVANYLRSKHHDIAVVHGGTARGARDRIFGEFQSRPSPWIIVAHPQTLAHGLTLTEANTIVWYSPTQSLEIYEQANARINRPGQTSKTLIVHMAGTPVERATYARLQSKSRMQGCLLDLFAKQEVAF
jgi:SNF2 family DNA or RNA helicase